MRAQQSTPYKRDLWIELLIFQISLFNAHAAPSAWVQVWRLVTRLLISISCANIFENILVSICRLYVDVMKDKFLKKSLRPIISLTKYWHNSSTSSGILFWVISVDRVAVIDSWGAIWHLSSLRLSRHQESNCILMKTFRRPTITTELCCMKGNDELFLFRRLYANWISTFFLQ